ncbi:MAG TPA: DUF4446 family protein [Symbiobacteriaceae bacterium]|nr:DUF4446 family protein [Symbiobacteriaceae bacterium]
MGASVFDPVILTAVAAILAFAALVLSTVLAVRQSKLLKRYRLLLNGENGRDLEEILLGQGADIERLQAELVRLQQRTDTLTSDARLHVQKVGTVRFCAFPDTGSDLSFAIALLDANDNGVVLSSLYGRSESRTYAKPIQGGKSTYQLSDEEKEAIAQAMAQRQQGGRPN